MILRPDYINMIKPFIDVPLVKILAGVRRCGKSTILEMISDELENSGIKKENIIKRRYSSADNSISNCREMLDDLRNAVSGKGRCYLILDEVQETEGWEKAVNDILETCDADIYVTGSNSRLMSGEISTYLTGRYIMIPVYTLSFREFMTFRGISAEDSRRALEEYLRYGGFPVIGISRLDERSAYQIAEGIYSSVVTRDISIRHSIRNQDLFDRVVRFIVENIGMTFSASSVIKFLKSEQRSISNETIYNYIKWLGEAFIIYPCKRYDIQGRQVLKTQEKYYLSDISFIYSLSGFDPKKLSAVFENIVFLEMKRRGYDVYIGKNDQKEIDFIGIRRDEKIYVQVCVNIPSGSDRETENLMDIKDNYRKYVVCRDPIAAGNINGIEITGIDDFLLKKDW